MSKSKRLRFVVFLRRQRSTPHVITIPLQPLMPRQSVCGSSVFAHRCVRRHATLPAYGQPGWPTGRSSCWLPVRHGTERPASATRLLQQKTPAPLADLVDNAAVALSLPMRRRMFVAGQYCPRWRAAMRRRACVSRSSALIGSTARDDAAVQAACRGAGDPARG